MEITQLEFNRLKEYMYANFGINLEGKSSLIESRLNTLLHRRGFTHFNDYLDFVINDDSGQEISVLVSKLTTNYTYFMREEVHYKFLTNTILPQWEKNIPDKDLRIWSAGCSSGEEPYTAAMVLFDYFGSNVALWDTTILATDISNSVLDTAKKGIYSHDKLTNIPPEWLQKYFTKHSGDDYIVTSELKNNVFFANFNLMDSVFPFKRKFHVIFCRNVMIYFDNKIRGELANKFYRILEPGGYLMLGTSETLANMHTNFTTIASSIYKKEKNSII